MFDWATCERMPSSRCSLLASSTLAAVAWRMLFWRWPSSVSTCRRVLSQACLELRDLRFGGVQVLRGVVQLSVDAVLLADGREQFIVDRQPLLFPSLAASVPGRQGGRLFVLDLDQFLLFVGQLADVAVLGVDVFLEAEQFALTFLDLPLKHRHSLFEVAQLAASRHQAVGGLLRGPATTVPSASSSCPAEVTNRPGRAAHD